MKLHSNRFLLVSLVMIAVGLTTAAALAEDAQEKFPATMRSPFDPVIHVSAFDFPQSGLLSAETRNVLERQAKDFVEVRSACLRDSSSEEAQNCASKHY